MQSAKLYLIPTPIGNDPAFPVLSFDKNLLYSLRVFVVESSKVARHFLKSAAYPHPFDTTIFIELNEQTPREHMADFLPYLIDGQDVGLMSDAGLPCIADPGAQAVSLAHAHGITVIPLPGPSSIFLALMSSGFNGQQFSFHGYLPIDRQARARKIRELEKCARHDHSSQVFMETPYRNLSLIESLISTCKPDTSLCIACSLLSEDQVILCHTIEKWNKMDYQMLQKKPAIFILHFR